MSDLAAIIKAYDVRGIVPDQFDAAAAAAIGSAFAQVVAVPDGASAIVVGHDMRPSSPELSEAFARGVAGHGIDVTIIGLCSTDGLYFASGDRGVPGAMFTASHNPARYNGIKMCRAGARPVGRDTGLSEITTAAQAIVDGTAPLAPEPVTRPVTRPGLADVSGVSAASGIVGRVRNPVGLRLTQGSRGEAIRSRPSDPPRTGSDAASGVAQAAGHLGVPGGGISDRADPVSRVSGK